MNIGGAWISDDGRYRYRLKRVWGTELPCLGWIMLNPSTANATTDDQTIRRCMGFARTLGYDAISVVNLYALRATNPADLWTVDDPIGPHNDEALATFLERGAAADEITIAAWGNHAPAERVAELLAMPGAERLHCLSATKSGAPAHPSRLPAAAQPTPWRPNS
ncbi:MAG: DUF1643 domain-containing protein [Nocardioides sp.]